VRRIFCFLPSNAKCNGQQQQKGIGKIEMTTPDAHYLYIGPGQENGQQKGEAVVLQQLSENIEAKQPAEQYAQYQRGLEYFQRIVRQVPYVMAKPFERYRKCRCIIGVEHVFPKGIVHHVVLENTFFAHRFFYIRQQGKMILHTVAGIAICNAGGIEPEVFERDERYDYMYGKNDRVEVPPVLHKAKM
jgi:hypothetical protein